MTPEEKFDTCNYRSSEPRTITVVRCPCQGGNYDKTVYICHKINISDVQPHVCEHCPHYIAREIPLEKLDSA